MWFEVGLGEIGTDALSYVPVPGFYIHGGARVEFTPIYLPKTGGFGTDARLEVGLGEIGIAEIDEVPNPRARSIAGAAAAFKAGRVEKSTDLLAVGASSGTIFSGAVAHAAAAILGAGAPHFDGLAIASAEPQISGISAASVFGVAVQETVFALNVGAQVSAAGQALASISFLSAGAAAASVAGNARAGAAVAIKCTPVIRFDRGPQILVSMSEAFRVVQWRPNDVLGVFVKQPQEYLDYDIDYADWVLRMDDSLLDVLADVQCLTAEQDVSMSCDLVLHTSTRAKFWIRGGTPHERYRLTTWAHTAGGRIDESELVFRIKG